MGFSARSTVWTRATREQDPVGRRAHRSRRRGARPHPGIVERARDAGGVWGLRVSVLRCGLSHHQGGTGANRRELRFVFRNFPISTSHPHAEQAAEAAEAAGAQGRFWEMHDTLYENQSRLAEPDLHAYAQRLELDVQAFDRELAEHVHAGRVREDFMSGVRSRVNGTPTLLFQRRATRWPVRPRDAAFRARARRRAGVFELSGQRGFS